MPQDQQQELEKGQETPYNNYGGDTTDPTGEGYNQNRMQPYDNKDYSTDTSDPSAENNGPNPYDRYAPNKDQKEGKKDEKAEKKKEDQKKDLQDGKKLAEHGVAAVAEGGANVVEDAKAIMAAGKILKRHPILMLLTFAGPIMTFIFCFLILVAIMSVFAPEAPADVGGGTNNTSVEKIIQVAESQLGTRETAGNCNPYGPCEAWCADFVSWVYDKAGTPFKNGRIASAIGVENYFKTNGIWISDKSSPPKPGYTINYGDGYSHIDLVVAVNGDTVSTIGGNEGQIGIVKKDTFNWRTANIHGYGGFRELYE